VRVDVQIAWQHYRHLLASVGEVDILCSRCFTQRTPNMLP